MITIIDYGMGNLGSIHNMLKKLGEDSIVTSDLNIIEKSSKIILPGVGSFDSAMNCLNQLDLVDCLNYKAMECKVPILGICLGAQLMTKSSEEGVMQGLNWFDAKTIKFNKNKFADKVILPNIGWRKVTQMKDEPIFSNLYDESWFYFAHNYHFETQIENDKGMYSDYGYEFIATLVRGNIIALQFHPEKSHKYGLRIFENFIKNY